jgi:acyl-coenzyme A synthetase/AMP-(fatty) acid ligase
MDWQNITDPIFHWAAERPGAPAFHEGHRTLTYGELAPLVAKAAVHLDGLGIRAGVPVAISLTNSIDHFILTLGLLRLGATTMEIPYDEQEVPSAQLLANFAIRAVFLEPTSAPVAGLTSVRVDAAWRSLIEKHSGDHRHPGRGDDIFTITLTSGTTGKPKGSLTSHRQYFQRMRAYTELYAESGAFSSERPATLLLTASVGFSTFFRRMISHLFIGGAVAVLPEFMHLVDLAKAIGAWDDALCFVPSAMCRFLISCAPNEGLLFPRLRALIAGGGFIYPEEKLAMLARVTPRFYEAYGASGFGTIAVLPPGEMQDRAASVGRPPSFVEVQVVGSDGQRRPTGEIGRLRCRGTQGRGFAGDTEPAGDERFLDGWYYPGDLGHIDDAGYVFLRGRAAEVITRNGIELFAVEIEQVIALHSSVAEVAIVGVPRPVPGDELVGLVVSRGEAQHEALAQHCRSRLPVERWPDRIFYAQFLPKTAGGKLDRGKVREMVMSEIQRQTSSRGQYSR